MQVLLRNVVFWRFDCSDSAVSLRSSVLHRGRNRCRLIDSAFSDFAYAAFDWKFSKPSDRLGPVSNMVFVYVLSILFRLLKVTFRETLNLSTPATLDCSPFVPAEDHSKAIHPPRWIRSDCTKETQIIFIHGCYLLNFPTDFLCDRFFRQKIHSPSQYVWISTQTFRHSVDKILGNRPEDLSSFLIAIRHTRDMDSLVKSAVNRYEWWVIYFHAIMVCTQNISHIRDPNGLELNECRLVATKAAVDSVRWAVAWIRRENFGCSSVFGLVDCS